MNVDATLFFDLLLLVMHISNDKIRTLASQLFELFENNIQSIPTNDIRTIKLYIDITQEILNYKLNATDHKANIINTIVKHTGSPVYRSDHVLKKSLLGMLEVVTKPDQLASLRDRLNNVIIWYQANAFTNKIYGGLKECRLTYNSEDQSDLLTEVKTLVHEFKDTLLEIESSVGSGGPVEVIDFSKKASLGDAVDTYEDHAVKGVLKTGLQGLNQMMGKPGGFLVGTMVIFAALQHHFKTGMLMYILRWLPQYNPPANRDPTKNLILLITLENAGYMNLIQMFEHIYSNVVGGDPTSLSRDEVVEFIYDYFQELGYTLVIERHLPKDFGYDELVAVYEKYISAGFEIKAVIIDYLEKMKKSGSSSRVGNHILIQELFNSVRNFFSAVSVNIFTAAQLNRDAAMIAGSGIRHVVKNFSERHLAGSIDIGREADTIIYNFIEKDEQGNSFLTMKWGKCRYVNGTPEVDKFAAWRFVDEYRGIPDDIGVKASHVRDIYAQSSRNNKDDAEASDLQKILGI